MAGWPDDFETILRTHCRLVPVDEDIEPTATLVGLGVDSLAVLGLIVDIEEAFAVAFPPAMLTTEILATPDTLWRAVIELRAAHP